MRQNMLAAIPASAAAVANGYSYCPSYLPNTETFTVVSHMLSEFQHQQQLQLQEKIKKRPPLSFQEVYGRLFVGELSFAATVSTLRRRA